MEKVEEEGLNPRSTGSNWTFLRQCFVTAGVATNIVGHGCVIGFSAILIPSLRLPGSHIKATVSEESWIASVVGFALILGNCISTVMMDVLGRKRSHLLTTLPILTGWFLLLLVNSVQGLIFARFLQGISMGMLGPLGSVIIGEMTDPVNRGAFLTIISLSLTTGVLTTHTLGIFLSWQKTALICSFITFTSLCLIIFAPESPPWLTSQGRYKECREVFAWLRGTGPEQNEEVETMIRAQMRMRKSSVAGQKISLAHKTRRFFKYFNLTLRKPEFYKPVIIMAHMFTLFQFAGINVISSYMMDIIKHMLGPEADARFWMIALGVERLIANISAVFLMRKFNRRTILFICGFLCVLSYISKASYVYFKQHGLLPFDHPAIPISLIGLYMFSLSVGITTVPFAVSGEIFPLEYRGLGGGVSGLALSFNFFLAVKSFPILIASTGLPITYLIYGSVVTYCLTVIWFMLPETKGKTLQEIEDGFRGKSALDDRRASEPLDEDIKYSMARRCSSQILY